MTRPELDRCLAVLDHCLVTFEPDRVTYYSVGRRYPRTDPAEPPWTAGFLPGQYLLAWRLTGRDEFLAAARRIERSLAGLLRRRPERFDHDLGFQFFLTSAWLASLAGDGKAGADALLAARVLASRFVPAGGYLQAHGPAGAAAAGGRFIVDCLMNLPLLYWAAAASGDERLRDVARRHAETTMRLLLRPDGSVAQAYDVAADGTPLGEATLQGVSPSSRWTRGQAWAIYGFALAYRALADERFLAASRAAADGFLAPLGDEAVAPFDFDADPAGPDGRVADASASAIAASGLAVLSKTLDAAGETGPAASRYAAESDRLLDGVLAAAATDPAAGDEGLIAASCYHYPRRLGIDECTAWGDYFTFESLARRAGVAGPYEALHGR